MLRARDLLLLEAPAPRLQAQAEGGAAGQLTVLLAWHTYAASFPQRYPAAIASVTGTGLAIPAAYR